MWHRLLALRHAVVAPHRHKGGGEAASNKVGAGARHLDNGLDGRGRGLSPMALGSSAVHALQAQQAAQLLIGGTASTKQQAKQAG